MLGKLFKHEFQATIRVLGFMYLIVLGFTGGLMISTKLTDVISFDSNNHGLGLEVGIDTKMGIFQKMAVIINVTLIIGYIVSIIAVNILTLVYLIYRYYQTMVCDEGYLTHTLPVKTSQLIVIKTTVALLYQIATFLISALSIFSIIMFFTYMSGKEAWTEFKKIFGNIIPYLKEQELMTPSFYLFLFLVLIGVLACMIYQNLTYFTSIAAGNLFSSNKLAGSIAVYIIYNVAVQFISGIAMLILSPLINRMDSSITIETNAQAFALINCFLGIGIVVILVVNTALFFVSHYILKNKLNLA